MKGGEEEEGGEEAEEEGWRMRARVEEEEFRGTRGDRSVVGTSVHSPCSERG